MVLARGVCAVIANVVTQPRRAREYNNPVGLGGAMKSGIQLVAALLLCMLSPLAMAQERMDDVLGDFQAHGYPSVSAAITRLQAVDDVPGKDAPLARRASYHGALLDLSRRGQHQQVRRASIAALERMADDEDCVRCRFDLALAAFYDGGAAKSTRAAAVARLREAGVLQQQLGSQEAMRELLSAQAALGKWQDDYNEAISLLVRASELAKKDGDVAAEVEYLAVMASLNADRGDPKRAIDLGNDAFRLAEDIGYLAQRPTILLDLGHAYSLTGERAKQRAALEKALVLVGDDRDLAGDKIIILNNLADFWLSQPGGYPRTLQYARQALALARGEGRERESIAPLANIGIAQAGLGQVDQGVAALRESIELSKKEDIEVYTLGITQELVRVLREARRYEEALDALQTITDLQEKRAMQARETAVLGLQEKYSAQRRTDEIEKLAAQNKLKQSQLEAENWKQRLWIALAIILGLVLLGFWQSIKRARRANRKLTHVNAALALQSATDALTGAFNRRHAQAMLDGLQQQMEQAPTGQGIGLMLLDLDLFKRINDTRGHAAGDAVLVETVKRLQAKLRQNDVVARWGGEEFVLVLPTTPAAALPLVAKKVLDAIGGEPIMFEGQAIPASVSLGIVAYPMMPGQSWAAALGLADSALYLAKASGRNQAICLARVEVDAACSEADLTRLREAGLAEWQVVEGRLQPPHASGPWQQGPSPAQG